MNDKIARKLSPTESRLCLINSITPHNVLIAAHILSTPDDVLINEAINILKKKHVLLNVYIEKNEFYAPSFSFSPENQVASVESVCNENIKSEVDQEIEQLLCEQLDAPPQPLYKVKKVYYEGGCWLFFLVHHVVCDGTSIISVFADLLDIIRKLQSKKSVQYEASALHPSLNDIVAQKYTSDFDIQDNGPSLFDNPNNSKYRSYYLHVPMFARSTGVFPLELSESLTKQIQNKCKAKDVSVHSFLCANLGLALRKNLFHIKHDTNAEVKIGCNTLVDLRSHLGNQISDDTLGFYSGCMLSDYGLTEQNDIWSLSKHISNDIKTNLQSKHFIKRIKRHELLMKQNTTPEYIIESIRVDEPAISVSNMGVIEKIFASPELNIVDLRMAGGCHAHSRNQDTFFILAFCFLNKLIVNIHYVKPIVSKERVIRFSEAIQGLIEESVNV